MDRHVSFLGKQDHVERLIPLAHVLLMPSELESFGLAALEAMACGVVPVATRVGGVPELITDGEDGYLEAVGDIAAQAARVAALLTDDALHSRMAGAGRWNASERFCSREDHSAVREVLRRRCDGPPARRLTGRFERGRLERPVRKALALLSCSDRIQKPSMEEATLAEYAYSGWRSTMFGSGKDDDRNLKNRLG